MTQEQAIAAVISLTDKKTQKLPIAKNSLAFKTAISAIENPGVDQVCGKNMGSGNYASSKTWQEQTANILRRAGIKFETSNIAPKGGKSGDRIKVLL